MSPVGKDWGELIPEFDVRYRLGHNNFQSSMVELWCMVYMYIHGREDECRELAREAILNANMANLVKHWETRHPDLRERLLKPSSKEDEFIMSKYFVRDDKVAQDKTKLWLKTLGYVDIWDK